MISFRSDYSQGAHPAVLAALARTNEEHTDGYGVDPHCDGAAERIRAFFGCPDHAVHFMIGGTQCNVTVAATLRPYEGVISARSGHIWRHETGAVEATGHRIVAVDGVDGKLTPKLVELAMEEYEDEHTVKPGMVYISEPTESGTVYSLSELRALRESCDRHDILLYCDGARLGSALACGAVPPSAFGELFDAFYVGGTKNGALLGEALVVRSEKIEDHFRFMMKRQNGLLAKGRLLGVQFEALFDDPVDPLYLKIASHENGIADILRRGLSSLGVRFFSTSPTNQVFPVLPEEIISSLEENFFFYKWGKSDGGFQAIRLVTGWGTTADEAEAFVNAVEKLL